MKHKTEDYKISAVKYYINNEVSMDKVCEIFECKKTSLKRWVDRYEKDGRSKDIVENLSLIKLLTSMWNMLLNC